MATTESRTGFRLPWSSEDRSGGRQAEEPQDDKAQDDQAQDRAETPATPIVATDAVEPEATLAAEAPTGSTPDQTPERAAPSIDPQVTEGTPVLPSASPVAPSRPAAATPRKPTKFLADLTKAMQAAAETSRAATLEQFQADAKNHIEQVHARSADEIAEIRREADDDIVGIREWSKAELARIREETERKIGTRRKDLEGELEAHAARVERRIDGVQSRVAGFEAEMDRFFERLLHEEDPAEFAAMAENLPEPPSFDDADGSAYLAPDRDPVYEATAEEPTAEAAVAAVEAEPTAEAEPTVEAVRAEAVQVEADDAVYHATAAVADAAEPTSETTTDAVETPADATDEGETATQDDRASVEAAMAAIETAHRAADETTAGEAAPTEPAETVAETQDQAVDGPDPRLAMLGLTPDLGEAEAEAAALAAGHDENDEIPTIGDDALAARLAGLVPASDQIGPMSRTQAPTGGVTSKVVVTGLISVASIASFKRHLGRIEGVQSVGVSSGPDGEFVFAVVHLPEVVLGDVVPTLSGFEARVTGTGDGVLTVSARDPESEA
jgi:hypothetical protein